MEFAQVLNSKTIVTHLDVKNKEEALDAMAQLFVDIKAVSNKETYLKDVYVREEFGATGIGNHIAIPHGKSEAVITPGIAIAVLENEVEWESLDDTGAKVVILFAVGADNESAQEHLKLLAMFSKRLGDDVVVNKLLTANTPEDVICALTEEETDISDANESEEELDLDEICIL